MPCHGTLRERRAEGPRVTVGSDHDFRLDEFEGAIRPRVSETFPLDRYEEAFSVFEERSVMGKAVFVMD